MGWQAFVSLFPAFFFSLYRTCRILFPVTITQLVYSSWYSEHSLTLAVHRYRSTAIATVPVPGTRTSYLISL